MQDDAPTRSISSAPTSASSSESAPAEHRRLALLAPLVPLLAIVAVWQFGDLSMLKSPERVAAAVSSVRESPLAPVYVIIGFSVGTVLFVPITGLIVGTILAFGPALGFLYALLGAQTAAVVTYWAGRASGSLALEYASGPRLTKLCDALRRRAFRASIIARILPLGNFTVINAIAGSARIPFRAFFFGNFIGLLPGLIFLTFFAERISEVVRNPSRQNLTLLAAVGVALLFAMYFMRRYVRRERETTP